MYMHAKVTLAIALALCVGGCGRAHGGSESAQAAPQNSVQPDSSATPTNGASFQLMAVEMPARLTALQQIVAQAGKQCASVKRASLMGGLDGTDEWRVDCSDSGSWQVWFSEDTGISVDHCSNAQCA